MILYCCEQNEESGNASKSRILKDVPVFAVINMTKKRLYSSKMVLKNKGHNGAVF